MKHSQEDKWERNGIIPVLRRKWKILIAIFLIENIFFVLSGPYFSTVAMVAIVINYVILLSFIHDAGGWSAMINLNNEYLICPCGKSVSLLNGESKCPKCSKIVPLEFLEE